MICARCHATGLRHYWPNDGARDPVQQRAVLTAHGYPADAVVCSACLVHLEVRGA